MSIGFKKYLPVWAIFFIAINATAWIMPIIRSKMFWTAYGIVNCAFVLQLISAYFILKQRKEVSIPSFIPSFVSLIFLFVVDAIGLYYFWPTWVLGVINLVIIVLTYLLIIIIGQNSQKMVERDEHFKEQTNTMLTLTKEVKALYDSTNNEDIYRLYEALKYSNKKSKNPEIEKQIFEEIAQLKLIKDDKQIKNLIDQTIELINNR